MAEVKAQFEKAVALINSKPAPGTPKPKIDMRSQLEFYALYKQATEGKNNTKEPSKMDAVNHYKWKAWKACGDMTKEQAMAKYLEKARAIAPKDAKL